jgi:aspartyl-tRNA(Asn)/glutamyl-tRNA(Gln) amidotransferase subunit B
VRRCPSCPKRCASGSARARAAGDAGLLTAERGRAYFEALVRALPQQPKLAANWIMGELSARLNRENLDIARSPVDSSALAGLLARVADGTLSGKLAKEVFDAMWEGQGSADRIIDARALRQISDSGGWNASWPPS